MKSDVAYATISILEKLKKKDKNIIYTILKSKASEATCAPSHIM